MKIEDFVPFLARKAGDLIVKQRKKGFEIEKKSKFDLVTTVDKKVEDFIISNIKENFPLSGVVAEESAYLNGNFGDLSKCEYIWIIDPIDGTTNFTHGFPHYCVSIALFKRNNFTASKNYDYLEGEIVSSAVYAPQLNEMFTSQKGEGSFLNDKAIQCSVVAKANEALVVTGFSRQDRSQNTQNFLEILKETQGIRRTGSAALDLCYMAAGRFDAFWEFDLKAWGIAAGSLIAKEAGCKLSDTNGNQLDLFGGDILVTNNKLHKWFVKNLG